MSRFDAVNLIRLFDFYLAAMFVIGTYRRIELYRAFAGLALSMPGRWPRLFQLVRQHRTVFLTWNTILPSALALTIWRSEATERSTSPVRSCAPVGARSAFCARIPAKNRTKRGTVSACTSRE